MVCFGIGDGWYKRWTVLVIAIIGDGHYWRWTFVERHLAIVTKTVTSRAGCFHPPAGSVRRTRDSWDQTIDEGAVEAIRYDTDLADVVLLMVGL